MNWLNEYEAKLKAATSGPWYAVNTSPHNGFEVRTEPGPYKKGTSITGWGGVTQSQSDAEFIAASPEMVTKLIAAVKEAEKNLKSISNGAYYDSYTMMYEVYLAAEKALDKLESGEFGEGDE